MGSRLKLSSVVNVGSTFNFSLKVEYAITEPVLKDIPCNLSIPNKAESNPNSNIQIERLNPDILSSISIDLNFMNKKKIPTIKDDLWDIPKDILSEWAGVKNIVPLFINSVHEGWQYNNQFVSFQLNKNESNRGNIFNKEPIKLNQARNSFEIESVKSDRNLPDIKINQNNSRRIEEEKEPPQREKPIQDIINLSQNKIDRNNNLLSSSSSSSDYFDEEEQKDKIHDNVSLHPQIIPMRRASRIVSFQQSKCNSHFEVDVNSLRLKSNIVNQSSLSEELERV